MKMNDGKGRRRIMVKAVYIIALLLVLLTACAAGKKGNSGGSPGGSSGGGSLDGTWYEQSSLATSRIEISGKTLKVYYKYDDAPEKLGWEWTFRTKKESSKRTNLVLSGKDKEFMGDLYYEKEEDRLVQEFFVADLGIERTIYKRTEYVEPPKPVYGERTDKTDPDAPKEIHWDSLETLTAELCVFPNYRGYMIDVSTLPAQGFYRYVITKKEDGGYELVSNFCRKQTEEEQDEQYELCTEDSFAENYCPYVPERFLTGEAAAITLPDETLERIVRLAETRGIANVNGFDVMTADAEGKVEAFTLETVSSDGTSFRASANYEDVPSELDLFMNDLNQELFSAFIDAGYDPRERVYDPWIPAERFGMDPSDQEEKAKAGVTLDSQVSLRKDSEKYKGEYTSWHYDLFKCGSGASEGLKKVLEGYNARIRSDSEKGFAEASERLEKGMKGYRKKKDEIIFSGGWTSLAILRSDSLIFCFRKTDGLWDTFLTDGPEEQISWYIYDTKTGKELGVKDLFTDPDRVLELLMKRYEGYRNEIYQGYFQSDVFRKHMEELFESGHVDMLPGTEGITFNFRKGTRPGAPKEADFSDSVKLPYEELEGLMDPKYTSVW